MVQSHKHTSIERSPGTEHATRYRHTTLESAGPDHWAVKYASEV